MTQSEIKTLIEQEAERYADESFDRKLAYIAGTTFYEQKILPEILEGLNAKLENYRCISSKLFDFVGKSPEIGVPCQPIYDAVVDHIESLNKLDSRGKKGFQRNVGGGELITN